MGPRRDGRPGLPAVVALGGGRRHGGDAIDPRVGFSGIQALGTVLVAGDPLAFVHAADEAQAEAACRACLEATQLGDEPCMAQPVVLETLLG